MEFLQSCLQLELCISYWYFWWFCGINHDINLLLYVRSFGLKNCSLSSPWIAGFRNSIIPKLLIFSFLKPLLGAKCLWLGVQMGFSHSLVLIIGKRLKTSLKCFCHSSIKRKHMFSLWPQEMVPLCAKFPVFQGWSEDIFNEVGKCYGFSCQLEVCSQKWRTSAAALFCCRLRGVPCASKQAQLKSMASPGCAVLTAGRSMFLSLL